MNQNKKYSRISLLIWSKLKYVNNRIQGRIVKASIAKAKLNNNPENKYGDNINSKGLKAQRLCVARQHTDWCRWLSNRSLCGQ